MLFRLLLSVLVVCSGLVIFDTPANACECSEGPWTATDDLEFSEFVFRGVVTSLEWTDDGGYEVGFSVVTSWKGSVGSEITVWTPDPSDQCGYQFQEGVEYVVFVWDDTVWVTGSRYVSSCSRTEPVATAGFDLAELGPGIKPDPERHPPIRLVTERQAPPPDRTWIYVLAGFAGYAGLLSVIWLFQRRRRLSRLHGQGSDR